MEYVIGFWLVGVVMTALYISAVMFHRKTTRMADLSVGESIVTAIFTCIVWPIFLIHTIHTRRNSKNLRNLYRRVRSNDYRK